ncbi:MAG: DNA cytosine methyltransferase [Roseiarcus sp.]|jgi:DNA (cytosine-5)-methyltransferase 1
MSRFTFYEFFAGGGMARAGLGAEWNCVFANDFDSMKTATYEANWGHGDIICEDVAKLSTFRLPGKVDLAWASFPCQDLSLAGDYAGLGHSASPAMTRSGTFWPFWALMKRLKKERRAPRLIVLENVYGTLTSNRGRDFAAIGEALSGSGYKFGAIVVDAIRFVPQSRPRVFFVAVERGDTVPELALANVPSNEWHPRALIDAYAHLSASAKKKWVWWQLPSPPARKDAFSDLIEDDPVGIRWHTAEETAHLIDMMSPVNRAKVESAKRTRRRVVGAVYKRTRPDANGVKRQRAEVRFDEVAGCLRTPRGGSSRQTIILVEGSKVRSRLLSPREAARLMGLADGYKLPERYNDAYHVAGDGVCVPAVRHLAAHLLEPLLRVATPEAGFLAAE